MFERILQNAVDTKSENDLMCNEKHREALKNEAHLTRASSVLDMSGPLLLSCVGELLKRNVEC